MSGSYGAVFARRQWLWQQWSVPSLQPTGSSVLTGAGLRSFALGCVPPAGRRKQSQRAVRSTGNLSAFCGVHWRAKRGASRAHPNSIRCLHAFESKRMACIARPVWPPGSSGSPAGVFWPSGSVRSLARCRQGTSCGVLGGGEKKEPAQDGRSCCMRSRVPGTSAWCGRGNGGTTLQPASELLVNQ